MLTKEDFEHTPAIRPDENSAGRVVAPAEAPLAPASRSAFARLGYRAAKRAFDVVFSAGVIAVGAIPAAALAIAIRRESEGSPIYCQTRVNGINPDGSMRTFTIYKFRSMYKDADERLEELKAAGLNEADGPLFKMKDDPRITPIGRFIRKHSIDEMPQFVNALMGQISVVGPRPPLPDEVREYGPRELSTLSVKPGITSYWQTSGRSDTTFEQKVDLDLDYIRDRSILTDLRLVAKTIGVVITGGGRLLAAFTPLPPRGVSHAA